MNHFTMAAGETVTLSITATDSTGAALNLTGSTLAWILSDGERTQVTKSTDDGITVTNAAGGLFSIRLDAADTADLPDGLYYHRAQVTDADDAVTTLLSGRVRLTRVNDHALTPTDYQD